MRNKKEISSKTIINNNKNESKFKKFITKSMKEDKSSKSKERIFINELAERLGVNYDYLRRIIDMTRPTKHRDCIIAICSQLRLGWEDTNKAIYYHNKNMPLLSKNNKRDKIIIGILESWQSNPYSIAEIDEELIRNGFDPLLIKENRKIHVSNSKFLIKSKKVTLNYDEAMFDQYNSLETNYSLDKYNCYANMLVQDNSSIQTFYLLTLDSKDNFKIDEYTQINDDELLFYEECSENLYEYFSSCFKELKHDIKMSMREIYDIVNDTKNYSKRYSAKFINDSINVFIESFNFAYPELNEYFYCELQDSKFTLYVSKVSLFMSNYLSIEDYEKYYSKVETNSYIKFSSIEEIEKYYEQRNNESYRKLNVKRAFNNLKHESLAILNDIKERKIFIRNLNYIWDVNEQNLVCKFFDLEKEFELREVYEENGNYFDANESAMVIDSQTNEEVLLTLEDLYKAFELGVTTKDEIIRIKKIYGCVDAILNT